jgi:hypothetical protein
MRRWSPADLALPGSGLFLDGRIGVALGLLLPAILILAALLAASALGGFAAGWALPRLVPIYLLLAIGACGLRLVLARREQVDPARVRELARAAARAWLRREPDAAARARAVTAAAPELAQAWRLVALVAGDARAARRAEAIERR